MQLRWMIKRDLKDVLRIEKQCFVFPWDEAEFCGHLGQRHCIGMVAVHDENVVGYMLYELHKHKLHVINFAVSPDFRRCGFGRQMVERLVDKLDPQRRTSITLVVSERNVGGQLFFRAMGFRAVRVIRDAYETSAEDGYEFRYSLPLDDLLPDSREAAAV